MTGDIVNPDPPRVLSRSMPRPSLPREARYLLSPDCADGPRIDSGKLVPKVDHVDLAVGVLVRYQQSESGGGIIVPARNFPLLDEQPASSSIDDRFPSETKSVQIFLVGLRKSKLSAEGRTFEALRCVLWQSS